MVLFDLAIVRAHPHIMVVLNPTKKFTNIKHYNSKLGISKYTSNHVALIKTFLQYTIYGAYVVKI